MAGGLSPVPSEEPGIGPLAVIALRVRVAGLPPWVAGGREPGWVRPEPVDVEIGWTTETDLRGW